MTDMKEAPPRWNVEGASENQNLRGGSPSMFSHSREARQWLLAEHLAVRSMVQCLREADARYWDRRAATFEQVGTPTAAETAFTLRRHAALLRHCAREGIS